MIMIPVTNERTSKWTLSDLWKKCNPWWISRTQRYFRSRPDQWQAAVTRMTTMGPIAGDVTAQRRGRAWLSATLTHRPKYRTMSAILLWWTKTCTRQRTRLKWCFFRSSKCYDSKRFVGIIQIHSRYTSEKSTEKCDKLCRFGGTFAGYVFAWDGIRYKMMVRKAWRLSI